MSQETDWKTMAGTEGTGEYLVIARNACARIGVRALAPGSVRIRIEPATEEAAAKLAACFTQQEGWKQPGDNDQFRFSIVESGELGIEAVLYALRELAACGKLERNTAQNVRTWRRLFTFTASS